MPTPTTSWLDLLSKHPIFTLDDQEYSVWERSRATTNNTASTFKDSYSATTTFLDTPRFEITRENGPSKPYVGKQACMVVRDGDLFVAIQDKLRVLNLNDYKNAWVRAIQTGHLQGEEDDKDVSWMDEVKYKTLDNPNINFTIRALSVNPNGKLMAVAGDHEIVVVVLPRSGYTRSRAEMVECRAHTIGAYYHSADASSKIVKVRWHPLSESRSHIVVLTMDGFLRMYNIAKDIEEPEQIYNFSNDRGGIPASPIGTRGSPHWAPPKRYTSDEDTLEAVSFCFGQGDGDWGTFAVYCLMRNGDVYSMCPVLPARSLVPRSLLDNLACLISKRYDEVHQKARENPRLYDWLRQQYRLQMRWISEALSSTTRSLAASPDVSTSGSAASILADDHALSNTISSLYADPSSNEHHVVVAHSPANSAVRQPLQRQGPYLFQPAPVEFGDEGDASDIFCLKTEPIGVVAIAFEDGKVDVCLEVERVEARWEIAGPENSHTAAWRNHLHPQSPPTPLTSDLPIFTVYESIDLGFRSAPAPSSITASLSLSATPTRAVTPRPLNHPTIVPDPMYTDTFYVYHRAGAHAVVMKTWLDELWKVMVPEEEGIEILAEESGEDKEGGEEDLVEAFVVKGKKSDVCWIVNSGPLNSSDPTPIIGFTLINDIYLSYSILLLSSTLQFVGLELSLRTLPHFAPADFSSAIADQLADTLTDGDLDDDSVNPSYIPLLPLPPFKIPDALERFHGLPRQPRIVMQVPPDKRNKEIVINEESLRFLAKTVETFREEIRIVLSAGNEIQHRLDLQRREQQRQLDKLAAIAEQVAELSGPVQEQKLHDKLTKLLEAQKSLVLRADTVLQILMDRHEPELSDFERRYIAELHRLRVAVRGERGFDVRVTKLRNQYELLKKISEEMLEQQREQRIGRMSMTQLHKVRGALSHEMNLIDETKQKVEAVETQMRRLGIKD